MTALHETPNLRQIEGEPRRRWFSSDALDLIVWLDEAGQPFKFQLCYLRGWREQALTWESGRGFDHAMIDAGEDVGFRYKGSPVLRRDGPFDRERVRAQFLEASALVPDPIRNLVSVALAAYPYSPPVAAHRPPRNDDDEEQQELDFR